ncbi:MAG: dipicolinate synthase subunit DpsA [Clostridiales bacterium]|nr:dipicolinate synthase subunit DpsA [Clostridiales bacterium]
MKITNIGFIGGDMRIVHLIQMYANEEYNIRVFGFEKYNFESMENITICKELSDVISDSDILIGPVPFTSNYETLNAPFSANTININDILIETKPNQLLICGRVDAKLQEMFHENSVRYIDILSREEFAVLNAISTSEGALQIAMEHTNCTLHNSEVLVLGFGRIGKILCKMLDGIGAKVYCEARKFSDLAWIKAYGYTPILLNDLEENIPKFNLFINTIPYIVFDKNKIDKMHEDAIFIDLASKPGGIDLDYAKEKQIKTILGLSLPGKVAPFTAANHMKETIDNIIGEQ